MHQGSGLLTVDPGPGEPVHIFAAPDASRRVPVIRARFRDGHLVVTADGPVGHTTDTGPGGLTGALGRWAEGFAAQADVPQARLRPIPPVWCSWYQYYDSVTEADIAANLAAMGELGLGFGVVQIDDGYQAAPGDWPVPRAASRACPA
jgi:alpha-galactosidase